MLKKAGILYTRRVKPIFITVCLITIFLNIYSQEQRDGAILIKNIPREGILLDNDWRFMVGDKPEWANADFNDSAWPLINPAKDIYDIPPLWKDSVVWFRKSIYLDKGLLGEQLVLLIKQSGASQIYLNGKLIKNFGIFSLDPSRAKAYDPLGTPVGLTINKSGTQILSIRYILQSGIQYKTIFGTRNYGLHVKVNSLDSSVINDRQFTYFLIGPGYLVAGIFFILTILHFSLFWYNRSQKANLFFFIFTSFSFAGFFLNIFCFRTSWVEEKFLMFFLAAVFIIIGNLFMVISIYFQLNQKRGIWFSFIIACYFLVIFSIILPGYWGWQFLAQTFQILINIEILRVTILAFKRRRQGAKILAVASVFCLLCWATFILFGRPGVVDIFSLVVFYVALLSIPIAASINLGIESGLKSKLLKDKLDEVEKLSKITIEQEKEKQTFLATQNETLEKQVFERTHELQESLQNLKNTQAQLIQSEKMASLGELTAGIAHEIQNPLNFVNNFSEVNRELLEELNEEIEKGNYEEVKMIAADISGNEEKISLHGKRADAIVKGMLQHSRTTTHTKESTDINVLSDEYLRLAYHGFRAKDKSFNAGLHTIFDPVIGKVNIIPQDIGRVILNVVTNAFYAVNEKKKLLLENYEPTVSLTTKKLADTIEIIIADNGNGIPQKVVDKIFQPFFTTKPTGQGTGLGLSLAYDIVKAHGGEIKVNSTLDEGAEFTIILPLY